MESSGMRMCKPLGNQGGARRLRVFPGAHRMSDDKPQTQPAPLRANELPAPGYPVSEEAVDHWFRQQHGRAPTELELGSIMGAMADRETTPRDPH
jgi:hypothetical protein